MTALVHHGARDLRFESHDNPAIQSDTHAILKVQLRSICGSDLDIYHGRGFSPDASYRAGHETVGASAVYGVDLADHRGAIGQALRRPRWSPSTPPRPR